MNNGQNVGEGRLPRAMPITFSRGEGSDVGPLRSVVDFTYKLPFTFTGKIEKVTFELK